MSRSSVRALILGGLVALFYGLHQDVWYWRSARPFVFGFLPIGLFYHAVFTLACSVLMWLLVTYAWPAHLESPFDRSTLQQGQGRLEHGRGTTGSGSKRSVGSGHE